MSAVLRPELRMVVDAEQPLDVAIKKTRESNVAYESYLQYGRRSLGAARTCGQLLLEVKEIVGHGRFTPWIKEHCRFTHRSANYCMRLAVAYPDQAKFETVANLTVHEALRLAAGEEDARELPSPTDTRQEGIFSEEQAPVPLDAASQLLAQGIPITGELESVRQLRAIVGQLDRLERLALDVHQLDDSTLHSLTKLAPPLIEWLRALAERAQAELARRPRPLLESMFLGQPEGRPFRRSAVPPEKRKTA